MLDLFNLLKNVCMKLKHMHRCVTKNSLFRVINALNLKMYPSGLKEEMKYVDDLNIALNDKYSKVEIANMLRRIMSYVIITNSYVFAAIPQAKKIVKSITENEMMIVANYIISNNQYIANFNSSLSQNTSEKSK